MADVNANTLTTISTEPTTTDSVLIANRNTNEGKIIDYELLAAKILEKLASKTFSTLTTTSKIIPGAINELDTDVGVLNNLLYLSPYLGTLSDLNVSVSNLYDAGYKVAFSDHGTGATNIPVANKGGYTMTLIFYNGSQAVQVEFGQGELGIWMRKYASSAWTAWTQI